MKLRTRDRLLTGATVLLIAAGAVSFPGCTTFPLSQPRDCALVLSHTSHPLLGKPFGPENEEDTLDTLGAECSWRYGPRFEIELAPQWKLGNHGFYGKSPLLINAQMKYKIWESHRQVTER